MEDVSYRGALRRLTRTINKMACNIQPPNINDGSLTRKSEAQFWQEVQKSKFVINMNTLNYQLYFYK